MERKVPVRRVESLPARKVSSSVIPYAIQTVLDLVELVCVIKRLVNALILLEWRIFNVLHLTTMGNTQCPHLTKRKDLFKL